MNLTLMQCTIAATLCAGATVALAGDARSIALGGSVIANGHGVPGIMANPASMMAIKRRDESMHFRIGFNAEFRDSGDTIDTLTDDDNSTLIDDFDREIGLLGEVPVTCNPFNDPPESACVTGTQPLSDLSGQLLNIIDVVDEESLDGFGVFDLGLASTRQTIPFAVHLRARATGFATPDIDNESREYISAFNTLLDGGSVTLGDIENSDILSVDSEGNPLVFQQPEEALTSGGEGGALLRTQIGISLAKTFTIAGYQVDAGITPKFSSLVASSLSYQISDEFDEGTLSVDDRFENNEESASTFTTDVGGSMLLPQIPLQLAAVVHNLIPESIKTREGYEFETTPQLTLGAAYQLGAFTFNGDIALNSALQDNFDTQKIGVGVEYMNGFLALRAGLSHDAARASDSTALGVGFALGPFELGSRLSGLEGLELGAQLAFSF